MSKKNDKERPRAVRTHDITLDKEYVQWIHDIKQRFRSAQIKVSRGELTADVSADYLRNERISDCAFVSENARCQQSAGTLSEEGLDQQTDHNKNQAARYFAA